MTYVMSEFDRIRIELGDKLDAADHALAKARLAEAAALRTYNEARIALETHLKKDAA